MTLRTSLARRRRAALPPALAALLALGGDDPALWSPPPGAALASTHALELATELESLTLRLNERPVDPEDALADFDRARWQPRGRWTVRAVDRDLRLAPAPPLAGSVPLAFERTYAVLRTEGPTAEALAALIPVEPIRFERPDPGAAFERRRPDGSTDGSLALLAEDLSWRLLEPGADRAPGARWRLGPSAEASAALLTGLLDAQGLAGADAPGAAWALLLDRLHVALTEDGRVTVEWAAPDAGGGAAEPATRAPLALSGRLAAALDVAELLPEIASFEDADGRRLPTRAEAELALDLELDGRARWAIDDGVLGEARLVVAGSAELSARFRPLGPDGPLPLALTLEARWAVELTHGLTVGLE